MLLMPQEGCAYSGMCSDDRHKAPPCPVSKRMLFIDVVFKASSMHPHVADKGQSARDLYRWLVAPPVRPEQRLRLRRCQLWFGPCRDAYHSCGKRTTVNVKATFSLEGVVTGDGALVSHNGNSRLLPRYPLYGTTCAWLSLVGLLV